MLLALLLATTTPPSGAYVQIRNQGADAGYARVINCSGAGVTCTVDNTTNVATLYVPGSDGGGGGSLTVPICDAGYVLTSDAGALGCVDGIATATMASLAVALAANPTDCSSGQYANAIAASGNLTCAQVATSQLSGTITNAQLASTYSGVGACAASRWASTLNGNAAPTCTQPAFTDLSGSPLAGGSSPQVQYNNSGVLGGVSTHTSDGVHVIQATEPTIASTPASGDTLVMLAPDAGFLGIPAYVDAAMNQVLPYGVGIGQTLWFQGQQATWSCHYYALDQFGTSTLQTGGGSTLATIGTSVSVSWDAGSLIGRSHRVTNNSTTSANSGAGFQSTAGYVWRGNASSAGGFYAKTRVWLKTWPASRVLIGYTSSTSTPGAVEPSTTNDTAYIGADGPDTNLKACSKDEDAGPAADCITLGSNFPKNGGGYDITFEAPPNSSVIVYHVVRLDSVVPDVVGVMRRLPVSSALLAFHEWVQNTDAGQAVSLDSAGFYECGNW